MRLIDADALLESEIVRCEDNEPEVCAHDIMGQAFNALPLKEVIDAQPTIVSTGQDDAKKGNWIYNPDAVDWGIGGYVCSECGVRNDNLPMSETINPMMFAGSKYCPHCGARMDKEIEVPGDTVRRCDYTAEPCCYPYESCSLCNEKHGAFARMEE